MTKLRQIIKSKKGEGFHMTIFVALALLLTMTVIIEYYRLMIIAQGVRDSLQDAVISTVTENYADVYHSVREGYSGAYMPVAEDFQSSINYGDIYSKLASVHELEYNEGKYAKLKYDDTLEFFVYGLNVQINNAPIRSGDVASDRFEIDSYITLEVPIYFCGKFLPNMKIEMKTSAGYTPVF